MYGLEKTKKDISCCDYYVNTRMLGNYLALHAKHSFNTLNKEQFLHIMNPAQFMIRKKFLIANKDKIQNLLTRKNADILTHENTSFVAIPLLQVFYLRKLDDALMEKVFYMKYENVLRALKNQKKLLYDRYLYILVLHGIFGKRFILKQLKKKATSKMNASK
jgi:hypothetical protein